MAQLKDILAIERERGDKSKYLEIHLFTEGSFYRAYEWSAWLCCKHLNDFKVTRRIMKAVDGDMLFIGFPKTSLQKFLPEGCKKTEVASDHLLINLPPQTNDENTDYNEAFGAWRTNIPITEKKQEKEPTLDDSPVSITIIMKQVLQYKLEQHSPIECMQFISDIQHKLIQIL